MVQYVDDVITNISEGKTGIDIFTDVSSGSDYLAAGVGGAIGALPGATLATTMAIGAVGNIASDAIKGDISSVSDTIKSGVAGASANFWGYRVSKKLAIKKASQITSMDRMSRKRYVLDKMSNLTHRDINSVHNTFMDNPIGMVENNFSVFKNGIYSTLISAPYGKWVWG